MSVSSQGSSRLAPKHSVRSQRAWARIAGLAYWVVLIVDLTGMQLHAAAASRSLMLAGSLFTVPLALGLYYAVCPVQNVLAATALVCRLNGSGSGARIDDDGVHGREGRARPFDLRNGAA